MYGHLIWGLTRHWKKGINVFFENSSEFRSKFKKKNYKE